MRVKTANLINFTEYYRALNLLYHKVIGKTSHILQKNDFLSTTTSPKEKKR